MKAYLFCCLLFALASCSQDPTTGTTIVEGQVVEGHSRKPVPGASAQVYLRQNGGYHSVAGAITESAAPSSTSAASAASAASLAERTQNQPQAKSPVSYVLTGLLAWQKGN